MIFDEAVMNFCFGGPVRSAQTQCATSSGSAMPLRKYTVYFSSVHRALWVHRATCCMHRDSFQLTTSAFKCEFYSPTAWLGFPMISWHTMMFQTMKNPDIVMVLIFASQKPIFLCLVFGTISQLIQLCLFVSPLIFDLE